MPFERTLTVRFHEIDRAGIVYFARIFEYCHVVYEELLAEAAGCDLETMFRTKDWGMPLVHAEADYARPLRLGDKVRVRATIARQGERSLTFEYELSDATSGEPRAKARLVHACASLPTFAGRALPPDLLDGLRRMGLLPA